MTTVLQPSEERSARTARAGKQLVVGSMWMIALRWSVRLTGLISTIVLARLLTPRDFGIVAMAMLVIGALEVFSETGQRLALIRHPNPTREHYDSAWSMSLLIGFALAATSFLVAPLAELYFDEPRIVVVIQCLGLRALLAGFENIGIVVLRRELRFDLLFQFAVWQKAISFTVTLSLAVVLRNYWALVGGILTGQVAALILSYVMQPYRPRWSTAKVGEIWSYSIWALFKHIGLYLNSKADEVAVGGGFPGAAGGTTAMGHYTVAADLATAPTKELIDPISAALFPVMATVQHDPPKLRELYQRVLGWSAVICASTSIGVAVVADDLVDVVLGPRWQAVAPLIAWLALSGGLLGAASSVYSALDVIGKPDLSARLQWNRLVLLCLAVFPVAFVLQDLQLVAITRFVVTLVMTPLMFVTLGRAIGIPGSRFIATIWRPLLAGLIMGGAVRYCSYQLEALAYGKLGIEVLIGAIVFVTSLYLIWYLAGRPDGVEKELLEVVRSRGGGAWRRILGRAGSDLETMSRRSPVADRPAGEGQAVEGRPARKLRICLYAPIATADEYAPFPFTMRRLLSGSINRLLDRMRWRWGALDFNYHAWERHKYTNRGDISIRLSIRQFLDEYLQTDIRYEEISWGKLTGSDIERINRDCDLFVIAGGGYIFVDPHGDLSNSRLRDLELIRQIGCVKIAFGVGANSLLKVGLAPVHEFSLSPSAKVVMADFLRSMDVVGVRGEGLQQALSDLHIRQVHLIGDPALHLKPSRPASAAATGVRTRPKIGVNFAFHGTASGRVFTELFETAVAFLKHLSGEAELHYFVHCDTEEIVLELLALRGIKFRVVKCDPQELVARYAEMDVVVSQMLHSSILATAAGVPSVNVAYDLKNLTFFKLLGMEKFCIPHAYVTEEWLRATVGEALQQRAELHAKILEHLAWLEQNTAVFLAEVRGALERRGVVR